MVNKKGVILFSLIFGLFIMLSFSGLVIAAHEEGHPDDDGTNIPEDLTCLACGDGCLPYDLAVVSSCFPPTNGDPICGSENGECVVLSYEEIDEEIDDITEEEIDEELGDGGSVNGFDRFLDSIFQDDLENMKERFAEIRTLVRNGEIEEAREILEFYREVADNLENEISPEEEEEAIRLSRLIRKAVRDMEDRISDEEFGELEEIAEDAEDVEAAAEIAGKIKNLCEELHELGAWDEFERVCKTEDDGPRWQKDFFESLTDEQKEEAKEFGEIMSACMRTSGRDCNCAGIPHEGMASMCFEAAPLAEECEEGNEDACEQLDSLDFPDDLPEHLETVLDDVERRFGDDRHGHHIPKECEDAGVTDREGCMEIMIFSENSEIPRECKPSIREAFDNGERRESKFRRICEEIMFEKHAPDECIEAGITDPRECGDLFEGSGPNRGPDCRSLDDPEERLDCYDNAERRYDDHFEDRREAGGFPQPCVEAGATGPGECQEVMRSLGRDRFEETRDRERQCANSCSADGKAWDFSGGVCECFDGAGNFEGDFRHFDDREYEGDYDRFRSPPNEDEPYEGYENYEAFRRARGYDQEDDYDDDYEDYNDCGPDQFYNHEEGCYDDNSGQYNTPENDNYDPTRGGDGESCNEGYESDGQGGCIPFGTGNYDDYDSGDYDEGDYDDYDSGDYDDYDSGDYSEDSSSSDSESSGEDSGESDGSSDGEGSSGGITGNVVSSVEGNGFLDYFFR